MLKTQSASARKEVEFYITSGCHNCGSMDCLPLAENNLTMKGNAVDIFRQPRNGEEVEACRSAMRRCPHKAIREATDEG